MAATTQSVLVVEDEASIASFVALYLKNAGYDVATVGNGTDVRFKLIGGFFRLRVVGSGITLYAVGKGSGSIRGLLSNTGTWALNDATPRQLPDTIKPFLLTG